MRKKSHLTSIRLKRNVRLKGVLMLFFIFVVPIFPIFVVNLDVKVIEFNKEHPILYEENLVSSDQGEEIFKLIFGADAGPDNLDPQNSSSPNSFNVINQVCEGLFTNNLTDPNLSIIPNLATSKGTWLVNSSDTWYTLSLRPNVTFHDGTKFNATAVKFTFDRLAYLINNSMAIASQLYEYYDPDAEISYPIINKTVVIGEYTVRFELNKPYGPFEALLCFPGSYILSPASTPQFGVIDTLTGDLIGTGPFVYDHYLPDEEVLFHAFEDYWAGRANISILKFKLISEYAETYEKMYSFTTQAEANDGTWEYWNTDIGNHSVAASDTVQYWCWTDTGTSSTITGPPSGTACIYPETSAPTSVDDVYIATLADAEEKDASGYGLYVTFNTCMRGDSAGHMYFEYWDGNSWVIKDDWQGDGLTDFTARGPYNFTALENNDFKIRFRVVVGGTIYDNDFTFDEVRIYGYSKDRDARNAALLSGEVDIITEPEVSMFSTFSADPDITLSDAGQGTTTQFLSMNNRKINGTFRRAISYAINYSYIVNELTESPVERLKSPVLENLLFTNWSFDVAIYNVTKARETMQSMGFGVGWNTTYLGPSEANWSSASFATFNYSYSFGDIFRENLLLLLQDNLDKIGIEVTDAGIGYSEFLDILLQRNGYTWDMWELCWLEFQIDYNDPDNTINFLFNNRTSSFNTAFYDGYLAAAESSRDSFNLWDNVQLLMEAALFEINQSIRKPYYDKIQQILVEEDMPLAFGVVSHNFDAYRSYIVGFQSNSIGKLSFYGVTQNSSIAPQTIFLNSNQEWQYFRNANKCTGQGIFSDPYVVEDLVIDAEGRGSVIRIENSDVYFRIENCTVYNSESEGIRLYNVDNGELLNNTANNDSFFGIVLINSNYNNITGNNASNIRGGISLTNSDYNLICENILNYNDNYGIGLRSSSNNTIANNTANFNKLNGIGLLDSNYNMLSKNNVSNNVVGGIGLSSCTNNAISSNTANSNSGYGIGLGFSNDNAILNNEATHNGDYGISLGSSNYNNISINVVNNNTLYGINLDTSNYNDLWNNIASKNYNGIYIWNSYYNIISENIVEYNDLAGIRLESGYQNDLLGNKATSNDFYGIYLSYSENNQISANLLEYNERGIYLMSCYGNFISVNIANSNNDIGICLWYGNSNYVMDNNASYNGNDGIRLMSSSYNNILRNTIENNTRGIYLDYGYSNNIRLNKINNNNYGIYSYGSTCNSVSNNVFNNNTQDIYGDPEACPDYFYYFPWGNVIGIVIFLVITIVVIAIIKSKRKVVRAKSYRVKKTDDRYQVIKTRTIVEEQKAEIAPEPIPLPKVEEEVVPPKVAPAFIPFMEVKEEIVPTKVAPELLPSLEVVPPKVALEPIPPAKVVKDVIAPFKVVPEPIPLPKGVKEETVPPKVALEPISPVKVAPPKVVPKPIPPVVVVKEVPLEKIIIGEVARVFEGHEKGISSVLFSHDGKYAVSASKDKTIKIWEISSGKLIKTLRGHNKFVTSIALSPDGTYIVSGSNDKTVKVWEFSTGKLIRTLEGHNWFVTAIAVSPDGDSIVSGSFDKNIKIWDTNTGDIVRTLEGHQKEVRSVTISPDGEYIASASNDRTLRVWSLETGQIVRTIEAHRKHINSVVFSLDGKHIVSGSNDKTIKEWDIATGKLVRTFEGHTWDVLSIAVSLVGNYMASGSFNKEIKVWDSNTGDIVRTLEGHKREVTSVAISPDGKYIVSGSNDRTVKIWKNLK